MNLSAHFTLAEMTASETASRWGIDNTPSVDVVTKLRRTAQHMEDVRVRLGGLPIIILSGYRCRQLNRLVKGARNSQHMIGEAADFICPRFGRPADIVHAIVDSDVAFDQVILEFDGWAHISFSDRPRHEALVIDRTGTRPLWGDR